MICFGHRGAKGHEPENTLLSVETGLKLGADWIEVDVYAVEGRLPVIHDDRLERTTNGEGFVMEQSLSYLRSLDAGKGQRIPFLEEVMDLIGDRAGLNIELKGPATAGPVVAAAEEYIRHHGWNYDRLLISSFDHTQLKDVKKLNPRFKTGALLSRIPWRYARCAEKLSAYSVNTSRRAVNRKFVEDAHQRGLKMFVYTVNSREEIDRLRQLGADGIFTDYPELMPADD